MPPPKNPIKYQEHITNLKNRIITLESREKMRESQKKRLSDPKNHPFYGKKHKPESIIKNKESNKGKNTGERNGHWNGGESNQYCPKFNNKFKERVRAFFGYICVECGTPQNGERLHIHHVNFNKKACCDESPLLFVCLCQSCHMKTNTKRDYWKEHFTEIINSYYEGKCYLTSKEANILNIA